MNLEQGLGSLEQVMRTTEQLVCDSKPIDLFPGPVKASEGSSGGGAEMCPRVTYFPAAGHMAVNLSRVDRL